MATMDDGAVTGHVRSESAARRVRGSSVALTLFPVTEISQETFNSDSSAMPERVDDGARATQLAADCDAPSDLDGSRDGMLLSELEDTSSTVLPFSVERQIGEGPELVYFYSFPAYRELARLRNEERFPIKIGMSTRPVIDRVFEQLGTSHPEWPVVLMAIRCDDARRIERVLHEILNLQYAHVERCPGNEWFVTSLDEILSILAIVAPALVPS